MKTKLLFFKELFWVTLLITLMTVVVPWSSSRAVQLSGTYTIDSSLVATASNFKDLASAITFLNGPGSRPDGGPSNVAPFGVSGPVVFSIASGTYSLSSTLNIDSVLGSNSTNTITFDGGDATHCIIRGNIPNSPVITLNQCKYISILNTTIENLASGDGIGLLLLGSSNSDAGSYCSVKSCIVNFPNANSYANTIGISITSDGSGFYTSAQRADNIEVSLNAINGAYTGIKCSGGQSNLYTKNYIFKDNTLNGVIFMGISIEDVFNAIEVRSNTISCVGSDAYGLVISNCPNTAGVFPHQVIGNKVINPGMSGMYLNMPGSALAPSKIYNNMIGGIFGSSGAYGLYVSNYSGSIEVFHNTVNCSSNGSLTFYYEGSGNLLCKNNIFMNTSDQGSRVAFFDASLPAGSINYNVYYNKSGNQLIYRDGVYYDKLNFLSTTAGGDSSYADLDPKGFTSLSDLKLISKCNAKGANLNSYIPYDIDGQTRGAIPDIGCDEAIGASNDVNILEILSPQGVVSGTQNIKVKFKNSGNNAITSATFSLKVNGVISSSFVYSGSLPSCGTDSFVFPSPVNFVNGGLFTVSIYSENPNGLPDGNKNNDTLNTILKGALAAGTYTIDTAGSGPNNFTSFAQAIDALKAGILGPIVINVQPGIYSIASTLSIDSIPGSSGLNTVTFNGSDALTRVLTGSIANRPIIRLNQCKYVSIKSLTITNTFNGQCAAISIRGNISSNAGSNCSIKQCILNTPNGADNVSAGISVTRAENGSDMSSQQVDSIEIDSNIINDAFWGIMISGNSIPTKNIDIKVRGNTINNAYYHGLALFDIYNPLVVVGNRINMSVSGAIGSAGITMSNCQNNSALSSHIIANNKVQNAGQYGFNISNANGTASGPTRIYNNMISGGFRNKSGTNGIYLQVGPAYFTEVYHNTVNVDIPFSGSGNATAPVFYYTGSGHLLCKNNIFMYSASTGAGIPVFIGGTNPAANAINYNIYYNKASSRIMNRGGLLWTTDIYRTSIAGGDSSTTELNTGDFVSNQDLHLFNSCNAKGVDLTSIVPEDIDGQSRSTSPDMGCDEGAITLNTADISLLGFVSPAGMFNGIQTVKVKFKNASSTVLSSANFTLLVNNVLVATQPYSGSLVPCGIDTLTFGTTYNFTAGGSFTLMVYSDNPNSSADQRPITDTISASYITSLSAGVYTIDPLGSGPNNYIDFASATNALKAGILGPVVFNVAPGTYAITSSIVVPKVPGASAINSITFDGGSASTTTVIGNLGSFNFIFNVRGSQFIGFRNLTVTNTNSNGGYGFYFGGLDNATGAGSNCSVKKCIINLPNSSGNYESGIQFFDGQGGNQCDSIEIDSNVFNGGYMGISSEGYANRFSRKASKFRYNVFNNIRYKAIKVSQQSKCGTEILYNTINMSLSEAYSVGISIESSHNINGLNSHLIVGNKIKNAGQYGIYISSVDDSGTPHKIYNNMVCGEFRSNGAGIYLGGGAYSEIFHNTVVYDYSGDNYSAAFYFSGESHVQCKNNIFMSTAKTGSAYTAFFDVTGSNNPLPNAINYNIYVNNSSNSYIKRDGIIYGKSDFKSPIGGGDSSYLFPKMPGFVSDSDLHLVNYCFKGVDLTASINTDIDEQIRSVIPVIGCDEGTVSSVQRDIILGEILDPIGVFNGIKNVKVKFKNGGSVSLSAANFTLKINNIVVATQVYSGSLPECDEDSIIFTTPFAFNPGQAYVIEIYSSSPNGSNDEQPANDTLRTTLSGALNSGIYTIDTAGSGPNNFVSFEQAALTLKGGILGPIVINVAAGTYTLSNTLNFSDIPGSDLYSIIIDGGAGNANTRILTGAVGDNPLVRIYNSSHIALKNLSIFNTYAGSCTGIAIVGSNTDRSGTGCAVKNCNIMLPNLGSNLGLGISLTASQTALGLNTDNEYRQRVDSIEIDSNEIIGGFVGIAIIGALNSQYNSGINVRNNHVSNVWYSGINIQGVYNAVTVTGNAISLLSDPNATDGIYMDDCPNSQMATSHLIANNKTSNTPAHGIYIRSAGGSTAGNATKVYNNMITGAFTADQQFAAGIMINGDGSSQYYQVLHNTINFDLEGSSDYISAFMFNGNGATLECKNNIFLSTATSGNALAFYSTDPVQPSMVNHNIYFNKASSGLLKVNDTLYTGATFKVITAGGDSSYNEWPSLISPNDLHLTSACGRKGINVTSSVPFDIDGDIRPASPAIGCDEGISQNNDIQVLEILTPKPFSGSLNLKIRFRNAGAVPLASAVFSVQINGVLVSTYSYSGGLVTCGEDSFSFPTPYNFLLGDSSNIVVYSSLPNGQADDVPATDTIKGVYFGAFTTGIYTINPTGTGLNNFVSFTTAAAALMGGGVVGPVVFNVSPGTYTEQVSLKSVPGVSAINTIIFDGIDPSNRILQYGSSSPEYHTFLIEHTPFVTLKNLTIQNNAAEQGIAIHIKGNSHSTKIKHCNVRCKEPVGSDLLYLRGRLTNILISPETFIENCEIDSNNIRYGGTGIGTGGYGSGIETRNLFIRYNHIDTAGWAVACGNANGVTITDNRITNYPHPIVPIEDLFDITPIYVSGISGGNTGGLITDISRNAIVGYGRSAINVIGGHNAKGKRSVIANNMVSGACNPQMEVPWYAISLEDNGYFDVLHNSVTIDIKPGSTLSTDNFAVAYHQSNSLYNKIRNNIFTCKVPGGIAVYAEGSLLGLDLDYNNYSVVSPSPNPLLMVLNGTLYNTVNYIGGGGFNLHSLNKFVPTRGSFDLHLQDACVSIPGDSSSIISATVGGITIDGQLRGTIPDMGADDISAVTTDIGIDSLLSPTIPFSGSQFIKVRIKNYGSTVLSTANIKCAINNGVPLTVAFSGVLNGCDTATITFASSFNFASGMSYQIKVWTESPNGLVDGYTQNDTFLFQGCAAMNGVYTINPNGTGVNNFASMKSAVEQLYCAGVDGPVVFNMASGTYHEKLKLMYTIPGSSLTRNIIFKSAVNNADSVILTTVPVAFSSTVTINASFVTLKDLTITSTDTITSTWPMYLVQFLASNIPSDNIITRCKIIMPMDLYTSNDLYAKMVYGVQYNPGYMPIGKVTITDNIIKYGTRGVNIEPLATNRGFHPDDKGMIVENNTFEGCADVSILGKYQVNMSVRKNTIHANTPYPVPSSNGTAMAMRFLYTKGSNYVVSNKIQVPVFIGRGISLIDADGLFLVNNDLNLGWRGSNGSSGFGIEAYGNTASSTPTVMLFNNTLRINATTNPNETFAGGACVLRGNVYGILKNNNFYSENGVLLGVDNASISSDYNNFKTNGALFASIRSNGSGYTPCIDLNQWHSVSNNDLHSTFYNPGFVNDSNLLPNLADSASWSLNGRGIHLTEVTTDINGNPRPTNISQGAPDIGAYEFTPTSTPPAAIANPALPVAGTTQSFTFGGDTVAKITWAPASSVPSSVAVRQYSGEKPPAITSTAEHMYVYATVEMPNPGSSPNYTLSLNYRDSWLGTVANPNESSVKLAKKVASNPWFTIGTSSIDTSANTLSASGNTEVSATFSAANIMNPLPVKLLTLTATNLKGDVHVNWATATEVNSSYFMVERSLDGKSFKAIGKVKANGHTGNLSNYALVDAKAPFNQSSTLYYRLKIVDADGSFEYSDRVSVSEKQLAKTPQPLVYPNPFSEEVFATLSLEEASTVKIMVTDITGKVVLTRETELSKGVQTLKLSTVDLHPGMYFMGIEVGGMVHTQKITRY